MNCLSTVNFEVAGDLSIFFVPKGHIFVFVAAASSNICHEHKEGSFGGGKFKDWWKGLPKEDYEKVDSIYDEFLSKSEEAFPDGKWRALVLELRDTKCLVFPAKTCNYMIVAATDSTLAVLHDFVPPTEKVFTADATPTNADIAS